jgi:hypothetical protein
MNPVSNSSADKIVRKLTRCDKCDDQIPVVSAQNVLDATCITKSDPKEDVGICHNAEFICPFQKCTSTSVSLLSFMLFLQQSHGISSNLLATHILFCN